MRSRSASGVANSRICGKPFALFQLAALARYPDCERDELRRHLIAAEPVLRRVPANLFHELLEVRRPFPRDQLAHVAHVFERLSELVTGGFERGGRLVWTV